MTLDANNHQDILTYRIISDKLDSYEVRRDINQSNVELFEAAFIQSPTGSVTVNGLDTSAAIVPHATIDPYIVEANNGPKPGIRPTYFFDLNAANGAQVDVTISGDFISPVSEPFSISATGVDSTLALDDFLSSVAGQMVGPQVYVGVERTDTCLGVCGYTPYELDNVVVEVSFTP